MNLKECITCLNNKELHEFPKGRRSCKKCCNNACRVYRQKNKELIKEYNKKYKSEHKDEIKKYNHRYNIENRNIIQTRHTQYLKNKRLTDPKYKLNCTLRNRIKAFINGENRKKTKILLGCSQDIICKWLEFQFTNDMKLSNHGLLWHIDHVIPCNKFNINDKDEQLKCFNWSNLQPLYVYDNLSKKDTINIDEINKHNIKVQEFIKKVEFEYNNQYIFSNYDKKNYY